MNVVMWIQWMNAMWYIFVRTYMSVDVVPCMFVSRLEFFWPLPRCRYIWYLLGQLPLLQECFFSLTECSHYTPVLSHYLHFFFSFLLTDHAVSRLPRFFWNCIQLPPEEGIHGHQILG